MKRIRLAKIAIATTTFACTALFSFGWTEQRGASLSVESAQARVGRPLTPVSVAGVARRQNRRAAYGYGYGAGGVGAGVAAAAVGTTAAVAAATSPWGYNNYYGGNYNGAGYFATSPWGDYECRNPHGYPCNPHVSKNWWGTGTGSYAAAGYVARPVARAARYRNYGGAYIGY
jgi:hypothetical protein